MFLFSVVSQVCPVLRQPEASHWPHLPGEGDHGQAGFTSHVLHIRVGDSFREGGKRGGVVLSHPKCTCTCCPLTFLGAFRPFLIKFWIKPCM